MTFIDISGLFVSCFGLGFVGGIALGRVLELIRSLAQ